jgi:DNA-binding response OmpR family regulator
MGSARVSKELENQLTIFLVEPDDETRTVLKSNLQRYGYRVIIALDEEDALQRANGIEADLILVDVVRISLEDALGVGRRIRNHAQRNGQTPLVVMAEKFGADVEGTDVNVGGDDWITYLEDPGQLKNLLARLILQPAA